MSGVLHPVGPEPPQVYWVRRVIVIAAAVLALVLVIAVVANLNSAASATGPEAVPAAEPSTSSSAPADSSDGSSASATPAAGSSHEASSAPSNAEPTLSVIAPSSAAPKESASAGLPTKPSASSSATGSAPTGSTGDSKSAARSAKSGATASAALAACDPTQLRQTLTGTQRVTAKSNTTLQLSLINGGPATCQLTLSSDDFVLTVYSGKDRIWSTADCADLVKPTTVKIASQGAYEWQIVWNGLRSKKSCQSRPEIPRPGTYVATAQFTGATPVQLRMFLTK